MTLAQDQTSSRRDWLLSDRPVSRTQARLGRAYMTWLRFTSNRLAVVGLVIILALVLVAAFAPFLAPHSPVAGDLAKTRLLPPGTPGFWLGTDDQGRDILSRLIHGSRITLGVVLLVAITAAPMTRLAIGAESARPLGLVASGGGVALGPDRHQPRARASVAEP